MADLKWEKVFGEIVPAVQAQIARLLNLGDLASLAFGPNTHGFLLRLLSCLPTDRPLKVLTTDSEFHSLTRQVRRLEEDGLAHVTWVPSVPFADFPDRLRGGRRYNALRYDLFQPGLLRLRLCRAGPGRIWWRVSGSRSG